MIACCTHSDTLLWRVMTSSSCFDPALLVSCSLSLSASIQHIIAPYAEPRYLHVASTLTARALVASCNAPGLPLPYAPDAVVTRARRDVCPAVSVEYARIQLAPTAGADWKHRSAACRASFAAMCSVDHSRSFFIMWAASQAWVRARSATCSGTRGSLYLMQTRYAATPIQLFSCIRI